MVEILRRPANLIAKELCGKKGKYFLFFNPAIIGGPVILSPKEKESLEWSDGKTVCDAQARFNNPEGGKDLPFLLERGIIEIQGKPCLPDFENIPNSDRKIKAHLMLTNRCNRNCRGCYIQGGKISMTPDVAKKSVCHIMSDMAQSGFGYLNLFFFGGEPLLEYPLIRFVIDFIKQTYGADLIEKGRVEPKTATNGLLMTREMAEFFAENRFMVGFSPNDMLTPGANPQNGKKFLENLKMFRDICGEKRRGIPVAWITVIEENLPYLPEMTERILELGIRIRFSLWKVPWFKKRFDWGRLQAYNQQTSEQLLKCFDLIERKIRSLPSPKIPSGYPERMNFMLESMRLDWPKRKICGLCTSLFIIDQSGNVCPCPMALGQPLGSLDPDGPGILDLVQSQSIPDSSLECASCSFRFICGGGCPLELKNGQLVCADSM